MNDRECFRYMQQGGTKGQRALQIFWTRHQGVNEAFLEARYGSYGVTPDDVHAILKAIYGDMRRRVGAGTRVSPLGVRRLRLLPSDEEVRLWRWNIVVACANDYIQQTSSLVQAEDLPEREPWDARTLVCFLEAEPETAEWAFLALHDRYYNKFAARIRRQFVRRQFGGQRASLSKEDIENILQEAWVQIWHWATRQDRTPTAQKPRDVEIPEAFLWRITSHIASAYLTEINTISQKEIPLPDLSPPHTDRDSTPLSYDHFCSELSSDSPFQGESDVCFRFLRQKILTEAPEELRERFRVLELRAREAWSHKALAAYLGYSWDPTLPHPRQQVEDYLSESYTMLQDYLKKEDLQENSQIFYHCIRQKILTEAPEELRERFRVLEHKARQGWTNEELAPYLGYVRSPELTNPEHKARGYVSASYKMLRAYLQTEHLL